MKKLKIEEKVKNLKMYNSIKLKINDKTQIRIFIFCVIFWQKVKIFLSPTYLELTPKLRKYSASADALGSVECPDEDDGESPKLASWFMSWTLKNHSRRKIKEFYFFDFSNASNLVGQLILLSCFDLLYAIFIFRFTQPFYNQITVKSFTSFFALFFFSPIFL